MKKYKLECAAHQVLEALENLYLTLSPESVLAISLNRRITALRAALAEPEQEPNDMVEQLADALDSVQFYRRRCEALQSWQSKMRDPERTIVCDILANGKTLDPAFAEDRYTALRAALAEPVQEPVAWALSHSRGIEFSSRYPMQASKKAADQMARQHMGAVTVTPLYTAPPQRNPLTTEEIEKVLAYARAVEQAHNIK